MEKLNENWNIPEAKKKRDEISDGAQRLVVNSIECILDGDQLAELVGTPEGMISVYRQVIDICLNRIDEQERAADG